jgi:hypothetical protein
MGASVPLSYIFCEGLLSNVPAPKSQEKEIRKRKTSYQTILGNQIKLLPM